MTGRRGRRRKQLLDDLKEKRRYWKLKGEALDRTLWRTLYGRGYGPVVSMMRIKHKRNHFIEACVTEVNLVQLSLKTVVPTV
jgi:hypothetical protein